VLSKRIRDLINSQVWPQRQILENHAQVSAIGLDQKPATCGDVPIGNSNHAFIGCHEPPADEVRLSCAARGTMNRNSLPAFNLKGERDRTVRLP